MADSVSCTSDSNRVFTCEVQIDSDPTPAGATGTTTAGAATPAVSAAPPPPDPAVSALVNAYSKTYIPRVDQPYVTLQSLKTCASNELSVGLALLGVSSSANSSSTTNTLKTVLTVAKASYDTGNCWAREQENAIVTATNQKAVEYCESEGGVARSFVGNKLFCDMTEAGQ